MTDQYECEEIRVGKRKIEVPSEMCTNKGIFKEMCSLDTWNTLFTPEQRQELMAKFLPSGVLSIAGAAQQTIENLFAGNLSRFGSNQLDTVFHKLENGLLEPGVAKYKKEIKNKLKIQTIRDSKRYYTHILEDIIVHREDQFAKMDNKSSLSALPVKSHPMIKSSKNATNRPVYNTNKLLMNSSKPNHSGIKSILYNNDTTTSKKSAGQRAEKRLRDELKLLPDDEPPGPKKAKKSKVSVATKPSINALKAVKSEIPLPTINTKSTATPNLKSSIPVKQQPAKSRAFLIREDKTAAQMAKFPKILPAPTSTLSSSSTPSSKTTTTSMPKRTNVTIANSSNSTTTTLRDSILNSTTVSNKPIQNHVQLAPSSSTSQIRNNSHHNTLVQSSSNVVKNSPILASQLEGSMSSSNANNNNTVTLNYSTTTSNNATSNKLIRSSINSNSNVGSSSSNLIGGFFHHHNNKVDKSSEEDELESSSDEFEFETLIEPTSSTAMKKVPITSFTNVKKPLVSVGGNQMKKVNVTSAQSSSKAKFTRPKVAVAVSPISSSSSSSENIHLKNALNSTLSSSSISSSSPVLTNKSLTLGGFQKITGSSPYKNVIAGSSTHLSSIRPSSNTYLNKLTPSQLASVASTSKLTPISVQNAQNKQLLQQQQQFRTITPLSTTVPTSNSLINGQTSISSSSLHSTIGLGGGNHNLTRNITTSALNSSSEMTHVQLPSLVNSMNLLSQQSHLNHPVDTSLSSQLSHQNDADDLNINLSSLTSLGVNMGLNMSMNAINGGLDLSGLDGDVDDIDSDNRLGMENIDRIDDLSGLETDPFECINLSEELDGIDLDHMVADMCDFDMGVLSEEKQYSSFFSLIRDVLCSTRDHRMTLGALEKTIRKWSTSPSAAMNNWFLGVTDWNEALITALNFLAGNYQDVHPEDFVPYIEYKYKTKYYQWIGAGRDGDNNLSPLCELYVKNLDHLPPLKKQEGDNGDQEEEDEENEDSDGPGEEAKKKNKRPQTPPPPRFCTDWTVRPSTDQEKDDFQKQEKIRFDNPHKAYTYKMHKYESVVGPVKGVYSSQSGVTNKARGHSLLVDERPPYVTILALVRDAVARLPNGEGTRSEICEMLRDSAYLAPEASSLTLNSVVSGALDRLHYERDPCVRYDSHKKNWIYLHRDRSQEQFERLHHNRSYTKSTKSRSSTSRKSRKGGKLSSCESMSSSASSVSISQQQASSSSSASSMTSPVLNNTSMSINAPPPSSSSISITSPTVVNNVTNTQKLIATSNISGGTTFVFNHKALQIPAQSFQQGTLSGNITIPTSSGAATLLQHLVGNVQQQHHHQQQNNIQQQDGKPPLIPIEIQSKTATGEILKHSLSKVNLPSQTIQLTLSTPSVSATGNIQQHIHANNQQQDVKPPIEIQSKTTGEMLKNSLTTKMTLPSTIQFTLPTQSGNLIQQGQTQQQPQIVIQRPAQVQGSINSSPITISTAQLPQQLQGQGSIQLQIPSSSGGTINTINVTPITSGNSSGPRQVVFNPAIQSALMRLATNQQVSLPIRFPQGTTRMSPQRLVIRTSGGGTSQAFVLPGGQLILNSINTNVSSVGQPVLFQLKEDNRSES